MGACFRFKLGQEGIKMNVCCMFQLFFPIIICETVVSLVHHIYCHFHGVRRKLTFEDVSLLQLLCGGSLAEPPEKTKPRSCAFLQGSDGK